MDLHDSCKASCDGAVARWESGESLEASRQSRLANSVSTGDHVSNRVGGRGNTGHCSLISTWDLRHASTHACPAHTPLSTHKSKERGWGGGRDRDEEHEEDQKIQGVCSVSPRQLVKKSKIFNVNKQTNYRGFGGIVDIFTKSRISLCVGWGTW